MIETDVPRLSDVAPNPKGLRGDLDNIVAKALKKRPDERYASVTAFADDLRRYLNREPVSARPDTVLYRTGKFLRRRARAVAAAAGVVALVAALTAVYTVRLASERDRARVEAAKSAKMSDLLAGLITAADPYASRDREPTIREHQRKPPRTPSTDKRIQLTTRDEAQPRNEKNIGSTQQICFVDLLRLSKALKVAWLYTIMATGELLRPGKTGQASRHCWRGGYRERDLQKAGQAGSHAEARRQE